MTLSKSALLALRTSSTRRSGARFFLVLHPNTSVLVSFMLKKLFVWYTRHKRNLPWRKTGDAYRIFISELMLQQTQVDRVVPKYRAWLKQFPGWKSLAAAPAHEVIRAWAGLGYNRRALYAREAARQILVNGVPDTEEGWRKLRGIGPYMAAALTEFVNRRRALVIDTNIRRVIGRVFLNQPFPRLQDDHRILKQLDKITPRDVRHREFPQALMDMGTSVCVSGVPHCDVCPLNNACSARKRFLPENLQRTLRLKRSNASTERRHANKQYPDRIYRGRILTVVRQAGSLHVNRLGPLVDATYVEQRDATWIQRLVTRLEKDGLVTCDTRAIVRLPESSEG